MLPGDAGVSPAGKVQALEVATTEIPPSRSQARGWAIQGYPLSMPHYAKTCIADEGNHSFILHFIYENFCRNYFTETFIEIHTPNFVKFL